MENSTIVSDLCKQKAGFIAGANIQDASVVRFMLTMPIYILTIVHFFIACMVAVGCGTKREKLIILNASTLICGAIGLCSFTSFYTIQHQFYCIGDLSGAEWQKLWTFWGVVQGIPAGLATLDWLFLLSHVMWERELGLVKDTIVTEHPGSFWPFYCLGYLILRLYYLLLKILDAEEWAIDKVKETFKQAVARASTTSWSALNLTSTHRQRGRRDLEEGVPLKSNLASECDGGK